jgi:hypothetical protein
MRRTMAKTAKDQKTPSQAIPCEGMDHITSAQYVFVLSKKIRMEDIVPSTLPRQGGDQLLPCLHKAARCLLTTPPLKIGRTVQGARGGRQPPPPTPVDWRHYSVKTTSTED